MLLQSCADDTGFALRMQTAAAQVVGFSFTRNMWQRIDGWRAKILFHVVLPSLRADYALLFEKFREIGPPLHARRPVARPLKYPPLQQKHASGFHSLQQEICGQEIEQ